MSLPLARRVAYTGAAKIVEQDQARAALLKNVGHGKGAQAKRADLEAVNQLTHYTVEVGIGSPATTYTLLVDTGSANTWIGAGKAYVKTGSSVDTGRTVVSARSDLPVFPFIPSLSCLNFASQFRKPRD